MLSKLIEFTESQSVNVTEDCQYILLSTDYSTLDEKYFELIFDKSGVSAEIVIIYNVPFKGKLNITSISRHKATNTSCMTKVRGILNDKATSNYVGKILIEKSAQQTNSFLRDDVLVVGQGTKNESQPILMIDADDVKASHGATTGRISEDEIYYLQSRGFSRIEAQDLITEGFLQSLIAEISDEKIREIVKAKLSLVSK